MSSRRDSRGYPDSGRVGGGGGGGGDYGAQRRADGPRGSSRDYDYYGGDRDSSGGPYGRGGRERSYSRGGGGGGDREEDYDDMYYRDWDRSRDDRSGRWDREYGDDYDRSSGRGYHSSESDNMYRRRDGGDDRYDADRYEDGDRSSRDRKRPKLSLSEMKRLWPPPFHHQDSSSLYVFDARSGFFYEAESDFFYDPKSKLYYSNKRAAYFEYAEGQDPPFREHSAHAQPLQSSTGTSATDSSVAAAATTSAEVNLGSTSTASQVAANDVKNNSINGDQPKVDANGNSTGKMKIAISLKTRTPLGGGPDFRSSVGDSSVGTSKRAAATVSSSEVSAKMSKETADAKPNAPVETSRAQKAHHANISKWSDIQREKKATPGKTAAAAAAVAANENPKTTKKGEPMCTLCKRKFASVEKLRRHEEVSALHKQNLAKKQAADSEAAKKSAKGAATSTEYRDRAKDRRSMYGGLDLGPHSSVAAAQVSAPLAVGPSLERAREVETTEVVAPSESLGDSNIGSKMLQKLGWKKGASLGRNSTEIGTNDVPDGNASLKKDWEKIEAAAANLPRGSDRHAGVGGGY